MDPQAEPAEPVRRARPEPPRTHVGTVVLATVLTELVLIGGLANQWMSERAGTWILNERSELVANLKAMLIVFNWRFAPQSGDTGHVWLGQVVLVAGTLLLSAVFVAIIVRGPATFGRILVTCWLATIGATIFATYPRALITDQPFTRGSRAAKALFGNLSPNVINVLAAIVLGLVAGLVAATVATRFGRDRDADSDAPVAASEAPYVPPEQPPPFFPETRPPRPSPTGSSSATRFPRPPDDDDLGHVDE
jgi:hypothetical protein